MTDYSNLFNDFEKSKGRMFLEQEDINRSCFMRDRDRIIHPPRLEDLNTKHKYLLITKRIIIEQDYLIV